ncbi:hypothetical protein EW026_g3932 [Hermanssonia centrifuga]|uniref:AAA+ ATPase domain-containing protein n=1 Tax=Hermanssonia centrifuga TaxID=98765 RepID=A0A4S4KJY1_9APHY|nr:hypothetical protein EW026_g3932 [Hermanssonia centrifuga]
MAPQRDSDEPYIVITCEEAFAQEGRTASGDPLADPWAERASSTWVDPRAFGTRKLKELYPNHSVVAFANADVLSFPAAYVQPIHAPDMVSTVYFMPLARQMVAWDKYDFILYVVKFLYGTFDNTEMYLLHEGPEEPSRALVMASGVWQNDLHEEIYVFDSGYWDKNHKLWVEVQKADWNDVILKDEFKVNLKKDVFGFFDSENMYKKLAIPWKRGIIMYGPPGNGKTISMKAIMKGCDAKGFYPLYVKSFRSWKGEEGAMVDVFEKARQLAPCVLILEDLDSLINDNNRSFFLNQLDGIESNDGLLVIGTTNHLDHIDPALSNRPSRFDRKYMFDDPDDEERKLYVQYWQGKLKNNKDISFPDSLASEIVDSTARFSFAYLKEVFVSTLVLMAGFEEGDDKRDFADVIKGQIKALRKQLSVEPAGHTLNTTQRGVRGAVSPPDRSCQLDSRLANQGRIWEAGETFDRPRGSMPGGLPMPGGMSRGNPDRRIDLRAIAVAAANSGRSYMF